ncbi:MAG: serine/threonine-protein kinase [Myxococcota bacterium]|nr:serine/threonine-protein kinase [Myxococcota bacterium]
MTASPRLLNERYELRELIGEGGMGRVYLANDTRLQREVAIKFLPRLDEPRLLERFRNEAMAVGRLSHPNIITLFDYDSISPEHPLFDEVGISSSPSLPKPNDAPAPARPFLVFEYLQGHSITAAQLESTSAILDAILSLADALSYAHRQGVIHRDVKPDNIRVSEDGRIKLLDFGLATFADMSHVTQAGGLLGTANYMSPEQALGESVDERTDIFSLAAVLYELLVGRAPLSGENVVVSISKRISHTATGIREFRDDLSSELERVIAKALSREREQRYASMQAFADALRAVRDAQATDSQSAELQSQDTQTAHGLRQFGRYELIQLLAVGGMGEIYLARSRGAANFEKRCVIKKILPHLASEEEFVKKFIDEANIVVQLTHGNIVPVFDMGEQNGEFYIAMDYIPGLDLRSILKQQRDQDKLLSVWAAVHISCEVCKGLAYAHRKCDEQGRSLGIIHRDISPSNILISQEGEVKLVDFGIATAASKSSRSITGRLQGKFAYMSPEQARGAKVDARSDIFSTALVLYEMLTGHRPFEGNSDLDSLERAKTLRVEAPSQRRPQVPSDLDQLVLRALSKDAEHRYQSADDFLSALLDFLVRAGQHFTSGALAKELGELLQTQRAPVRAPLAVVLEREAERLLQADLGATPTADAKPKRTLHAPEPVPASETRTLTATPNAAQELGGTGQAPNRQELGGTGQAPNRQDRQELGGTGQAPEADADSAAPSPVLATASSTSKSTFLIWLLAAALLSSLGIVLWLLTERDDSPPEAASVVPEATAAQIPTQDVQEDEPELSSPHEWHDFSFTIEPPDARLETVGGLVEVLDGEQRLYRLHTDKPSRFELSADGFEPCSFSLDLSTLRGDQARAPTPVQEGCESAVLIGGSIALGGRLELKLSLRQRVEPVPVAIEDPDIRELPPVEAPTNDKKPRDPVRVAKTIKLRVSANVEARVEAGEKSGNAPFELDVEREKSIQIQVIPEQTDSGVKAIAWKRSIDPSKREGETVELKAEFCHLFIRVKDSDSGDGSPIAVADIYIDDNRVAQRKGSAKLLMPCGEHKLALRYEDDGLQLAAEKTLSLPAIESISLGMQKQP